MGKYIGRVSASLALAAVATLAACGGGDNAKKDTTLAADSALNRDLSMAGAGATTQPQLSDTSAGGAAKAPASTGATRTPTRSGTSGSSRTSSSGTSTTRSGNTSTSGSSNGGGRVGTIAAGSTLTLHPTSDICTNTTKVGDNVTATLGEAVTGTNGAVIPAGATVTLTATRMKRSENANDPIVMEFAVKSVTYGGHTYALEGTVEHADVAKVRNEPKSKDAQKVAIGAAAGAIAGQILGKNTKSTVIGGAVGAAAGAAAAAATANYEGCIRPSGSITVRTTSALQVKA